jgi:integrase/recombinase XerD
VDLLPTQYAVTVPGHLGFSKWFGERHENLELVSLRDVDEFLASKRQEGWSVRTIASQCQALRSFFRYAEIRGW